VTRGGSCGCCMKPIRLRSLQSRPADSPRMEGNEFSIFSPMKFTNARRWWSAAEWKWKSFKGAAEISHDERHSFHNLLNRCWSGGLGGPDYYYDGSTLKSTT